MTKLASLAKSDLLRQNAIFFVGSVATGALNYLYYPLIGRFMPPAAFGEVQTLVSLFLQLTIFLMVLSMITVNIVANYRDEKTRNEVIYEIEKAALLVGVIILATTIVCGAQLQAFFKFESAAPFTALALALLAGVPLTFRSAYVRGKRAFGQTSIVNVAAAASKIVLSLALVLVGLGTTGAIFGIVGAQLLAGGLAAVYAYRLGLRRPFGSYWRRPNIRLLAPELKYGSLVLVVSLAITLHYSIDIIAVKHYFDAHTAGVYAGIATVGRILFFLTASIVQVMLPAVKLDNSPQQNTRILMKSLALLVGVSLPVLAACVIAPEAVIHTLMGKNYNELANLLPNLSLSIAIIAVLNLVMTYFVALRHFHIAIIGILDFVVACGWVLYHHGSPAAVVESLLYSSVTMLGLLIMWVIGYQLKVKRSTHDKATHYGHRTDL
jgi:O-antigen/teichoic acid export membrane protein